MPGARGSLAIRFWAKVDKRGPDECWPWTGAVTDRGYGNLRRGKREDGTVLAHQAALTIQTGRTLKPGETIDHTCQFKLCMNAAHYDVCSRVENTLRRHARARAAMPVQEPTPGLGDAAFDLTDDYQEAA